MAVTQSTPSASGIYTIYCTGNGRVYVGSAVNVPGRWAVHRHELRNGKHHNSKLQRAWDKYGPESFVFSVLEAVEPASLIEAEQRQIDLHHAADPEKGFNLNPTAGSRLGARHSPECRARFSAMRRGTKPIQATIASALARTGKPQSEETKARKSASLKGLKRSPETCKRIGDSKRGRKMTDEQRRRVSAGMVGKRVKLSREQRAEVLRLVGEGTKHAEIAAAFGCSEATISNIRNAKYKGYL